MSVAQIVYFLCLGGSTLCAVLLGNAYRRYRQRVFLWTSLCFVFLAINNAMLYVDVVLLPEVDLSVTRNVAAFLGVAVLVFGLIWDVQ